MEKGLRTADLICAGDANVSCYKKVFVVKAAFKGKICSPGERQLILSHSQVLLLHSGTQIQVTGAVGCTCDVFPQLTAISLTERR